MKRGSTRKTRTKFLGAWIPNGLLKLLDNAVEGGDTDRSKFVRRALKEKVERTNRAGAPVEEKP